MRTMFLGSGVVALVLATGCKDRGYNAQTDSDGGAEASSNYKWPQRGYMKQQFTNCMSELRQPQNAGKVEDLDGVCIASAILHEVSSSSGKAVVFDESYMSDLLSKRETKEGLTCGLAKESIVPLFSVSTVEGGTDERPSGVWFFRQRDAEFTGWQRLEKTENNAYLVYKRSNTTDPELIKLRKKVDSDTFDGHRLIKPETPNVRWFVKFDPNNMKCVGFGEIDTVTKKELWRCDGVCR
jgi:hypothetical protein